VKVFSQRALAALAFTIALPNCSSIPTVALPSAATGFAAGTEPEGSWVSKDAASSDLLYVSDGTAGSVSMITYPQLRHAGRLIHFKSPAGLCVDKRGNVYILDHTKRSQQIREYAHASIRPIRVLSEDTQTLDACAVDLASGDLAVTSYKQRSGDVGVVAIYPKAQDRPKYYTDPAIQVIKYCAYDHNGNLFVDGWDFNVNFILEELPRGAKSFVNIKLDQSIEGPGGIQLRGNHLVIGDIDNGVAYEFAMTHNRGKRVSTTHLNLAAGVEGFALLPGLIISPEYYDNSGVGIWEYPKGGDAKATIYNFRFPENVAISRPQ